MNEIEQLKQILNSSSNIVFFGGAGVSTESNIPDFRSEKGIYNQNKYPYPAEEMLSRTFFINHKKMFYDFYLHEMIHLHAKPNPAHIALVKLEQIGKLKTIITQNIDGLHQMAGSKHVLELHGSTKRNHCMKCHRFYHEKEMLEYQGICPICHDYIEPDVVLYEDPLDEDIIQQAIHAIQCCDTLIVGGTSLNVYPAAMYIRLFRGKNLILINLSSTPYDQLATLIIHQPIGQILEKATEDLS